MKEHQEYAANKALDQYHLNLHVLYLNYNSTFTEMIKADRSMACIFHPENNYGYHTKEIMTIINTAKDLLQDRLRKNDRVREEEMSKHQKRRFQFHLITILFQNQAIHHPNQHHHILDHGH